MFRPTLFQLAAMGVILTDENRRDAFRIEREARQAAMKRMDSRCKFPRGMRPASERANGITGAAMAAAANPARQRRKGPLVHFGRSK